MIRRSYTYIVFAAGIALLVGGALKIVPNGVSVGASLAFLGLLMFGLSFIAGREPQPNDPAPMSEGARLSGIFFEPSEVFRNLRAHPRWLVPLIIIALVSFAYSAAFTHRLTPERIAAFTTDKIVGQGWMPADRAEQMKEQQIAEAKSPARFVAGPLMNFVGVFVLTVIVACLFLLSVLILGGRIDFLQAFSVAAYASLPVTVISRVLSLVILYIKDPDDIHPMLGQGGLVTDNLGALVTPGANPIFFALLSAFGVLAFYRVWLHATGLRHGGERVGSSTAWATAIAVWVIGLLISVASSALFGSFIS